MYCTEWRCRVSLRVSRTDVTNQAIRAEIPAQPVAVAAVLCCPISLFNHRIQISCQMHISKFYLVFFGSSPSLFSTKLASFTMTCPYSLTRLGSIR